ncbi:CAAX prenyl protease 2-like isoform X2 [Acanthaster planci]|uniref:CAAX prenyl protease 2 n=1 Tax=Acanthaster planci TaxID=133434 RepID=A0A8B7YBJ0_ACAPL|nr:CAAX prenyl protease 2-like isoform X2 [Acanthaster planci]
MHPAQKSRDDPSTIKRRSLSAAIVTLLAPVCILTQAHQAKDVKGYTIWQHLGVRQAGLITSLSVPLLLTMVLFLGPLYMLLISDTRQLSPVVLLPREWLARSKGMAIAVRNYIVGPVTEEIVFRACMLPLLVPCLGNLRAVFVCPLFFGVAHVHHVIEGLRQGARRPFVIWVGAIFQFFYTTVFGALSAFLFLRTGHVIACIIVHIFCNFMGFPAFDEIPNHTPLQRAVICATFVVGLLLFLYLLLPLTSPERYANEMYQWS